VALLFSRGAKTGQAYVYLDGKKVATIDTKQSATAYRQALWTQVSGADFLTADEKRTMLRLPVNGTTAQKGVENKQ